MKSIALLTFALLINIVSFSQSNILLVNEILSHETIDKLDSLEKFATIKILEANSKDSSKLKIKKKWSIEQVEKKRIKFDNKKYKTHKREYWNDNLKIKEINLYGAGSILSAASGTSTPDGSSPVNGSLGVSFNFGDRQAWSVYFSYNGVNSIDINTYEQLGSALLTPQTNGNSFIASWVWNAKWLPNKTGITSNLILADDLWNYGDSNSVEISPILAKIGVFWKPFPFEIESNKVNFILSASYTYRGALGDLHNGYRDGIELSDENVNYVLRAYQGMEFAAHLLVNSVDLYFQIPVNYPDIEIPGFGGAQVIFGLNISGDFIKLK